MRIILLSDIHFKEERRPLLEHLVAQLGEADLLLIAGDLTHFGGVETVRETLDIFGPVSRQVYAIAGNCDTSEDADYLRDQGINLAGRAVQVGRLIIQGMEGVPLWRKVDYGFTEDQLLEQLRQSEKAAAELYRQFDPALGAPVRLLLTHVPPYQSGADKAMFLLYVGSRCLSQYLQSPPEFPALPPVDFNFCGHIHEGRGEYQLGKTKIINIGAAKNSFYVDATLPDGDAPLKWEFKRAQK